MDTPATSPAPSRQPTDVLARRASRAHAAVAKAVHTSTSTAEMIPAVLRSVGTAFGWHFGAFWVVEGDDHLTCLELWETAGGDVAGLCREIWATRLARDAGHAGRAWHRQVPVSGQYLRHLPNTPYAAAAAAAGFRGSICIPALQPSADGTSVCAVLEFLVGDQIEVDDRAVHDQLIAIGLQVGQALERQALERELQERAEVAVQEEIVESLWLAQGALETGRLKRARQLIDETIDAAERIADE